MENPHENKGRLHFSARRCLRIDRLVVHLRRFLQLFLRFDLETVVKSLITEKFGL